MSSDLDDLATVLRAADRKVLGAEFARNIGDTKTAERMDDEAVALYVKALSLDPMRQQDAWRDAETRDRNWLDRHGLSAIPVP